MKQRISVRAIIRHDEKTLLLRRVTGRETILGKYELPGGKVAYEEQPEDARRNEQVRSDLAAPAPSGGDARHGAIRLRSRPGRVG